MKKLCRFVHPLVEGFASVRWKHGFRLMEAWFLPDMFSRICNSTARSISICNAIKACLGLQILILNAVELQIRPNCAGVRPNCGWGRLQHYNFTTFQQ